MDDCSRAAMQIGGKIHRSDIEKIAEAAYEDGAGQDYRRGEIEDLRRMIEAAAQGGNPVIFTAEDAILGAFDRLEATCRELDLAYVRHTGACEGAWREHLEFWEPEMNPNAAYRYACGGDGRPMLDYQQIRRLLTAGSLECELRIMEHIHRFPYTLALS